MKLSWCIPRIFWQSSSLIRQVHRIAFGIGYAIVQIDGYLNLSPQSFKTWSKYHYSRLGPWVLEVPCSRHRFRNLLRHSPPRQLFKDSSRSSPWQTTRGSMLLSIFIPSTSPSSARPRLSPSPTESRSSQILIVRWVKFFPSSNNNEFSMIWVSGYFIYSETYETEEEDNSMS